MTSRSQVSSDSLLILHFILELLEAGSSPACLLYEYMKTFIVSDDVVLEEVVFNLCDVARQDAHEKQINQLAQRLSDHPTQRVVIFITTPMTSQETSTSPQILVPWFLRSVPNLAQKHTTVTNPHVVDGHPPSISHGRLPTGQGGDHVDDVMWGPCHEHHQRCPACS